MNVLASSATLNFYSIKLLNEKIYHLWIWDRIVCRNLIQFYKQFEPVERFSILSEFPSSL